MNAVLGTGTDHRDAMGRAAYHRLVEDAVNHLVEDAVNHWEAAVAAVEHDASCPGEHECECGAYYFAECNCDRDARVAKGIEAALLAGLATEPSENGEAEIDAALAAFAEASK
jgi:hypothetical protein